MIILNANFFFLSWWNTLNIRNYYLHTRERVRTHTHIVSFNYILIIPISIHATPVLWPPWERGIDFTTCCYQYWYFWIILTELVYWAHIKTWQCYYKEEGENKSVSYLRILIIKRRGKMTFYCFLLSHGSLNMIRGVSSRRKPHQTWQ